MRIEYSRDAIKSIEKLEKTMKIRIKTAIEKLPTGDVKKLVGFKNDYRLRIGDYRVLFSRNADTITIKDVLTRERAYKRL